MMRVGKTSTGTAVATTSSMTGHTKQLSLATGWLRSSARSSCDEMQSGQAAPTMSSPTIGAMLLEAQPLLSGLGRQEKSPSANRMGRDA